MLSRKSRIGIDRTFVRAFMVSIILILIPWAVSLYADELNENDSMKFRMDSYIPELFKDLEWRIDGGFRLNGGRAEYEYQDYPDYILERINRSESDAQNLNAENLIEYRHITIPMFLRFGSRILLDHLNSNSESYYYEMRTNDRINRTSVNQNSSYYTIHVKPYMESRFYLNRDLFFSATSGLEWDYIVQPCESKNSHQYSRQIDGYDYITERWSDKYESGNKDAKGYYWVASIMTGWGREYEGNFAANTIYLVEELMKNRLILTRPDYEQMLNLTEILYQNRQKHVIDERISDIEAVTEIVGYLVSEGIMENSITGQNIISDLWKYYPRYNRRFGFVIQGGTGISHYYSSRQYEISVVYQNLTHYYHKDSLEQKEVTSDTTRLRDYSQSSESFTIPYMIISCQYTKPVNHRWQIDLLSQIQHYFNMDRDPKYEFKEFFDFHNEVFARYIVNTRTSVAMTGMLDYGHYKGEYTAMGEIESQKYTYDNWYVRLNLEANYRISIPTSLIISAMYVSGHPTMSQIYNVDKQETSNYLISASISHYIY